MLLHRYCHPRYLPPYIGCCLRSHLSLRAVPPRPSCFMLRCRRRTQSCTAAFVSDFPDDFALITRLGQFGAHVALAV